MFRSKVNGSAVDKRAHDISLFLEFALRMVFTPPFILFPSPFTTFPLLSTLVLNPFIDIFPPCPLFCYICCYFSIVLRFPLTIISLLSSVFTRSNLFSLPIIYLIWTRGLSHCESYPFISIHHPLYFLHSLFPSEVLSLLTCPHVNISNLNIFGGFIQSIIISWIYVNFRIFFLLYLLSPNSSRFSPPASIFDQNIFLLSTCPHEYIFFNIHPMSSYYPHNFSSDCFPQSFFFQHIFIIIVVFPSEYFPFSIFNFRVFFFSYLCLLFVMPSLTFSRYSVLIPISWFSAYIPFFTDYRLICITRLTYFTSLIRFTRLICSTSLIYSPALYISPYLYVSLGRLINFADMFHQVDMFH